ncbi:MAG: hypothetical protein ACJA1W_001069 [Akkermansiaceae bacterium]|jgi:hypothetical protein
MTRLIVPTFGAAVELYVLSKMIPLGYMAKRVADRPEWLKNSKVGQILSVSSCTSDDSADYVEFWRHNGFWFFDSPELIVQIADES